VPAEIPVSNSTVADEENVKEEEPALEELYSSKTALASIKKSLLYGSKDTKWAISQWPLLSDLRAKSDETLQSLRL